MASPLVRRSGLVRLVLSLLLHGLLVSAKAVQYCTTTEASNFCVALETFINGTSGQTDAYFTFLSTRETNSALGWNAIGLGNRMDGSVMFVMYGDPRTKKGPTLSVRTTEAHQQPKVFDAHDAALPDIRVVGQEYITKPESPAVTLTTSFICYSCDVWTQRYPDQPFRALIWATNPTQDFDGDYSTTADLQMHGHKRTTDYGFFYANIIKAVATENEIPASPIITASKSNIETQEKLPAGMEAPPSAKPTMRSRMWATHGFLLTLSTFFLHPLGAIAMRASIPQAFKWHWVIQFAASIISLTGMILGIILSRRFVRWHQYIGILLVFAIVAQGFLGWRHHMIYLRTKRSTWMSKAHVILGWVILLGMWLNLLLGMVLKHWTSRWVLVVSALTMMELGAVFFSKAFVHFFSRYRSLDSFAMGGLRPVHGGHPDDEGQDLEEYLAMSEDDSDDDDDVNKVYSQEPHGAMEGTGFLSGIPAKGLEEAGDEDKRTWLPTAK